MSTGNITCRVYALYPYSSTDNSSLSFEQGAIITVLAKLESGWWDGLCNGKRGWFPSNYVQVIPEEVPEPRNTRQEYSINDRNVSHSRRVEVTDPWRGGSSQYVEPRLVEEKNPRRQQLRLSLDATDLLISDRSTQMTESRSQQSYGQSEWIQQTTEDGSETYYYNVVTNEMRYSLPLNDFEYDSQKMLYDTSRSIISQNQQTSSDYYEKHFGRKPFLEHETFGNEEEFEKVEEEEKPVRPVRSMNRFDTGRRFSEDSVSPSIGATTAEGGMTTYYSAPAMESLEEEQLPPNWVSKTTPSGRLYFCNVVTEQTTWNLENIDFQTGALMHSSSNSQENSGTQNESVEATSFAEYRNASNQSLVDAQVVSWSKVSAQIAMAIQTLKNSIRNETFDTLQKNTISVVYHVRLLLYLSNSIDKDSSPQIKSNKKLRTHHRGVMASLAKLALSSKVASGAWPPPESINKLHTDADEVLVAVRNFIITAQEAQLDLHDNKPKLLHDGVSPLRWRVAGVNRVNGANPDATTTLLVLADNIHGATTAFIESANEAFSDLNPNHPISDRIKTTSPVLVAQFRNLSNTTSQFLNSMEDICAINPKQSSYFAEEKQAIFDDMGTLFIISQAITNQELGFDEIKSTFHNLEQCVKSIEKSVRDICDISRQINQDDNIDLNKSSYIKDSATPLVASAVNGSSTALVNPSAVVDSDGCPTFLDDPQSQSTGDPNTTEAVIATQSADVFEGTKDDVEDGAHEGLVSGNASDFSDGEVGELVSPRQPKDKLLKFFGEDTVASARNRDTIPAMVLSASMASSPVNSSPSAGASLYNNERTDFLGTDYNSSEIIFNMEGNVKGGTIRALVQRLTQHDKLDSKFITTFLLTYRSFCTTQELFEELFMRYMLTPPEDLTAEELTVWQEKKLKLVRLRVFNVIKSWLDTYFNEEEDQATLPTLAMFTEDYVRVTMKFGYDQLIKLIKKRMDSEENGQIRKMTLNIRSEMPQPILPKNMRRIRFLELDALEMARQLTIMDFKLYNRIKPVECLDKNWGKGDSEHIAVNVKASIEYSNQVTAWVTDSILSKDDVRKRAVVVKHWVVIAEKCRLLNNYNTCMAILSSFDNSSVGRLRRTWELMNARTNQTLASIRRLMGANRNFTEYRDIIHHANPPCIPFLGIYLQDLTFIEDGNSNYLKKSDNMINFSKRMKTAEVIRELQQHQSTPYLLQAVPDIQEFITTHLQSSRDEETLYNLSLALEPRERDEDTIVRRLKESGM